MSCFSDINSASGYSDSWWRRGSGLSWPLVLATDVAMPPSPSLAGPIRARSWRSAQARGDLSLPEESLCCEHPMPRCGLTPSPRSMPSVPVLPAPTTPARPGATPTRTPAPPSHQDTAGLHGGRPRRVPNSAGQRRAPVGAHHRARLPHLAPVALRLGPRHRSRRHRPH
jgi:hypothetical protein